MFAQNQMQTITPAIWVGARLRLRGQLALIRSVSMERASTRILLRSQLVGKMQPQSRQLIDSAANKVISFQGLRGWKGAWSGLFNSSLDIVSLHSLIDRWGSRHRECGLRFAVCEPATVRAWRMCLSISIGALASHPYWGLSNLCIISIQGKFPIGELSSHFFPLGSRMPETRYLKSIGLRRYRGIYLYVSSWHHRFIMKMSPESIADNW